MKHDEIDLISQLRQRISGYAVKRLRDAHLAEDIAQEVLMRLQAHRAALPDDPRRVIAWALRTAHNAIVDHLRWQRRARTLRETAAQRLDARSDDAAGPVPQGLAGCAASMVRRLPEPYRAAVELSDLRDSPGRDVAQTLGISLSSAKARVRRGRQRLRAMIHQCCKIEFGRRGSVVSVVPTVRARDFCDAPRDGKDSCIQSDAATSC